MVNVKLENKENTRKRKRDKWGSSAHECYKKLYWLIKLIVYIRMLCIVFFSFDIKRLIYNVMYRFIHLNIYILKMVTQIGPSKCPPLIFYPVILTWTCQFGGIIFMQCKFTFSRLAMIDVYMY